MGCNMYIAVCVCTYIYVVSLLLCFSRFHPLCFSRFHPFVIVFSKFCREQSLEFMLMV